MDDGPVVTTAQSRLDRLCALGAWLALPVSLLLAAQWPLRQFSGGRPQLANDIAQALFALYVALALRHTMHRGGHLRAAGLATRLEPARRERVQRWIAVVAAIVLVPWSTLLLWLAAPLIAQSLAQAERFPDTLSPGYFLIRVAMALLLAATGLQALLDAMAAARPDRDGSGKR